MDNQTDSNRHHITIITGLAVLLIIALVIIGWLSQRKDNDSSMAPPSSGGNLNTDTSNIGKLSSLVAYSLPDGWRDGECPNTGTAVYLAPSSTAINCDANPSAPIKLSIDPQNTTDCQQLQNVQNVKKHTCISLFIDGYKSLKSSTEYLKSSDTSEETTVSRYYINTNKGVVKLEYTYSSDAVYQTLFDQFATSITVK